MFGELLTSSSKYSSARFALIFAVIGGFVLILIDTAKKELNIAALIAWFGLCGSAYGINKAQAVSMETKKENNIDGKEENANTNS